MRNLFKPAFILIASAFLLSSCGIRGQLDTAPPMWGKAKQEYKKQQEEKTQSDQSDNKEQK